MAKNYVCPYCFEQNQMGDIQFRCQGNMVCPERPQDVEQARYRGLPAPVQGPAYFPDVRGRGANMPKSGTCTHCSTISYTRVCPDCHNVLPTTVDTDEQIIVSLIGTRGSGKSSYVGVLIRELSKRIMLGFNGTFKLMTDEDRTEYRVRFEQFLYPGTSQPTAIPQTQTEVGVGTFASNRPILGTVKVEEKKMFRKKIRAITLVFFDAAGENFEEQSKLDQVNRYIGHSSGIVFLVDPLAQSAIRSQIEDEVVQRSTPVEGAQDVSSPTDVVARVAQIFRNVNGLPQTAKIQVPAAVAFSKLDTIEPLLPPGAALSKPSPHYSMGAFVPDDAANIDAEMRGLLTEWGNADLIAELETEFADVALFGFTALGREPNDDGTLSPPLPRRIEDALLWLLAKAQIIPTAKR